MTKLEWGQQASPVQDRCVLFLRCFLLLYSKMEGTEVQTQLLPARESYILNSCSPCWLTPLLLYTVQSHSVFPSKAWWKITSGHWLNQIKSLTLAYSLVFSLSILFTAQSSPSVAVWKASTPNVLLCFWNCKSYLYSPAGCSPWTWDPQAGVSYMGFYGCVLVCKCVPVGLVGRRDSDLIRGQSLPTSLAPDEI